MGFLEEAIREHLELQRRRGGDPRQIAIAEREALEPLVPGHTPEWAEGPALFDHEQPAEAQPRPSGRPLAEPAHEVAADAGELPAPQVAQPWGEQAAPPVAGRLASQAPGASALDQETAELDMSAILGLAEESGEPQLDRLAGHRDLPEFGPVRAERIVPDPSAPVAGTEDFEWEIPGVSRSPGAGA